MKKLEKQSSLIRKKTTQEKKNQKSKIRTLFDIVVKNTIDDFNKNKEVTPHVIIITKEEKMLVAPLVDCNGFDERSKVLRIIAKKLLKNNVSVDATISVAEAWMSKVKDAKKDFTMPSKDPNRNEVLMVSAIDSEENYITWMYSIIRKGSEVSLVSMEDEIEILNKWVKKDEEKGIFDNMLLDAFWSEYKSNCIST